MNTATQIAYGQPRTTTNFKHNTINLFQPESAEATKMGLAELIHAGDYPAFRNKLREIMNQDSSAKTLSEVIATLSNLKNRLPFLQMLFANDRYTVLNNSYQHANGFEKWVLISEPNFKVRLHIYEDTRLIPLESRHNHSWDFASCIVEGCLQNTIYALTNEGTEELLHYQYSPVVNEAYETKLLGKSRLTKMTDLMLTAGTAYFMPAAVIHRISYEHTFKQRTVTMMITGPRKEYHCNLFTDKPFEEEKNTVERFEAPYMRQRFDEIGNIQTQ